MSKKKIFIIFFLILLSILIALFFSNFFSKKNTIISEDLLNEQTEQKNYNSNILLYPDYFYLQDYIKNGIRNVNNNNIQLLNNTIQFKDKKDNIVFRSKNKKYRFLEKHFDKNNNF